MSLWKNRWISTCLALGLGLVGAAPPAAAQDVQFRWVIVNGKVLDAAELAYVDALNCNSFVPNGVYWLNIANRTWGVVGQPGAALLPNCMEATATEPASAILPSAAPAASAANSGVPSIVGCWEGLFSTFFNTYYFAPDGTYREHTSPRAGEVGMRPSDAYGRYFVQRDSVNIIPDEGQPLSLLISLSDDRMRLGRSYLRCR